MHLHAAHGERENTRFMLVKNKGHNPNYTADAVSYFDEYLSTLSKKNKNKELQSDEAKKEFVASFDWDRMTAQDEAVWEEIFKALD